MEPMNCWEYLNCGREPGGARVAELGVCPAAIDYSSDGINGGKNAGRICWAVAGTLGCLNVNGVLACRRASCTACDFFKKVKAEEGSRHFRLFKTGQNAFKG